MSIATVQHDGIEISSNTATAEELRASFDAPSPVVAPEPPRPSAQADGAGESDDESPQADAKADQPRNERGQFGPKVQKRIDKLTYERSEAERREQAANDRIAALEARLAAVEKPKAEPAVVEAKPEKPAAAWQRYKSLPDAPKLDDFASLEDYQFAVGDFVAEQKERERTEKAQQEATQRRMEDGFKSFEEKGQAYASDFVEVMRKHAAEGFSFGEVLGPMIFNEPDGFKVGYELITAHPDELRRLLAADPPTAIRGYFTLAASLESKSGSAASSDRGSARPVPVSTAKPPIKPLESTPVVGDDPPDDDEAYRVWANRRDLAARTRRTR